MSEVEEGLWGRMHVLRLFEQVKLQTVSVSISIVQV